MELTNKVKNFNVFNVKDKLKQLTVKEIKEWQQEISIPYSVAIYNNVRDFNLASIIRNSSAFALQNIYIIGWRKYDKRGAVGAYNYVNINHFIDFYSFQKAIGLDNIVSLEVAEHYPQYSDTFTELSDFKWRPGQCLLIGEEGAGIPEKDLSDTTHRVNISIPGSMRSLNAATSSGIAMYSAYTHYMLSDPLESKIAAV